MNVLSLFDGISCCRVALDRAGIKVSNYYASEIDKHAITIAMKNYPDTVQLGDVTKWQNWSIDFASINIVTAGFPCQAWSVAGKQLGDKDERGALFWTTLDIISHIKRLNPKIIFLLENVKMKREFEEYITYHTEQALGKINKYLINSALVSAQNRQRYYWTNINGVNQPQDKGILIKDILENPSDEPINYSSSGRGNGIVEGRVTENPKKAMTLTATGYTNRSMTKVIKNNEIEIWHNLSLIETERLQTLPDNYTEGVSDTQRYKCLGNGWTVDVIAHIFTNIKNSDKV